MFGLDVGDDVQMGYRGPDGRWVRGTRSWLWLRQRIFGLMETPSAGWDATSGHALWRTRLQSRGFAHPDAYPKQPPPRSAAHG